MTPNEEYAETLYRAKEAVTEAVKKCWKRTYFNEAHTHEIAVAVLATVGIKTRRRIVWTSLRRISLMPWMRIQREFTLSASFVKEL